ncbi:lipopolysaccharide biosynthesis protein, partial [Bacteroides heparinolyticus]|uniref:lipopolysaccharide biosynthesis protein n=1 Tax=Prevotella heparinolytica TaxID=28113 RepID=UPI0035A0A062
MCTIASSALGFLIIPKYGVYGYVVSISIASCIASTYCFISARAYRYIKLNEISTGRLFEMLKYSMALVPTSVTWWMISTLNRPLLEKYVGYHDIGIYAVANKFPGLLTTVFVIFGTSWQISVMEEFGSTGYHKFYNNAVRGIFIVMAIVLIFMTAFCLPMLRLFTIPDYYDARFIMPFLAFSTLLSNLGSMAGTNFLATKQSRYLLYTSIWGALAAFFFNFLLIPQFGLMGAVASTLISMLILTISRIAYSYKYVKLDNLTSYISISFLVLGYFAIFYC